MAAHKTSRYCWAYESTPGTAEITAAASVTYVFGDYNEECGDWNGPFVINPTQESYVYAVRTPSLVDLDRTFPNFQHVFLPTTAQCYAWMLGKPQNSDPEVVIVALEDGKTSPLTVRLEEKGGTTDSITQAVGCYCVGLTSKAERTKSLQVETTFAWQSIEDVRGGFESTDVVSASATPDITLTATALTANQADNWQVFVVDGTDEGTTYEVSSHTVHASAPVITLTEAHTIGVADTIILYNKTRPFLTTMPVAGGDLLTGTYNGNPIVKWDIGGGNHTLDEVWRADWTQEQEFEVVSSGNSRKQTVNPFKFKPVQIILHAVFGKDEGWEDYIDRKASTNMTITVEKQDSTSYILATFTNCRIVEWKKTGHRRGGHYGTICKIVAEKVEYESDWFTEGGTNFATHWKAGV